MSSKKEEERNEKIIRGLLKLPPNRKCINCNSLGPQYVCTNFWTFICITCSGLHREFTHRVKSVSMAKFTSQEVNALQRGGNQRAREIFLKDWDIQRQKLSDVSNLDKVREFIKNVYVDRKYTGGNSSDKPPRDTQSHKSHEEDHRRASSYHSFSQSPPYEHQYEDRRYGKQTGALTRKPGSDRGHYEGKMSSFVYSPGRLGDRMYKDRLADEGFVARVPDYLVSSTVDPFRHDSQPPNFQTDSRYNNSLASDVSVEDAHCQANPNRDVGGISHSQRTISSGSFGSLDSNTISLASVNSVSLFDLVLEPQKSSGTQQAETSSSFPFLPQSSGSSIAPSLDHFSPSFVQMPETSSAPSIDLFADITCQNSTTTYLEHRPSSVPFAENEGWATFDLSNQAALQTKHEIPPTPQTNHATPIMPPANALTVGNMDTLSSVNYNMQGSSVQSSTALGPFASIANQWRGRIHETKASNDPTLSQPWNDFDDSTGNLPQASIESLPPKSELLVPTYKPPTSGDHQYKNSLKDFGKDACQRSTIENRISIPTLPFDSVITGSSFPPSMLPLMGGMSSHTHDRKSTNPFDVSYDSDFEPRNMFLDMSSLQTALPNPPLPAAYLDGLTEPWFHQNSVAPYIPAESEGGLAYMEGQALSSQFPNIPSHAPLASLGGNPFA